MDQALTRFPQGTTVITYPYDHDTTQVNVNLFKRIMATGHKRVLNVSMRLENLGDMKNPEKAPGIGAIIVNPPYAYDAELAANMTKLKQQVFMVRVFGLF